MIYALPAHHVHQVYAGAGLQACHRQKVLSALRGVLKEFKRSMYGRGKFDLPRQRVLYAAAG